MCTVHKWWEGGGGGFKTIFELLGEVIREEKRGKWIKRDEKRKLGLSNQGKRESTFFIFLSS